jgi:hypothetical protein
LIVRGPILQKVPYCTAVRGSTRFYREEFSYYECAMLHCSEGFGCVFAVGEFQYCKGARQYCSKRFGCVFAVGELNGEKVEVTLVLYQGRKRRKCARRKG